MNETPASSPNVEPDSTPHEVHVPMPSLIPVVTYSLLGVTVVAYLLQLLSVALFGYAVSTVDWLELLGARFNEAIRAGQVWRFITPVFLHGSPAHIFFNMYALFTIGSLLERSYGHVRFALLYFLGGFSGNVFSFLLTGENGYSIGASTAVFGLIAAEGIFFYQNRELFGGYSKQAISNAIFIIVVNLFIGLSPGIDNWGHVGGLLGGAAFAWFASPLWKVEGRYPDLHLEDQREFRSVIVGAAVVVIVFSALAIYGMR